MHTASCYRSFHSLSMKPFRCIVVKEATEKGWLVKYNVTWCIKSSSFSGRDSAQRQTRMLRRGRVPTSQLVPEVRDVLAAGDPRGHHRVGLRVPVIPGLRPRRWKVQLGDRGCVRKVKKKKKKKRKKFTWNKCWYIARERERETGPFKTVPKREFKNWVYKFLLLLYCYQI